MFHRRATGRSEGSFQDHFNDNKKKDETNLPRLVLAFVASLVVVVMFVSVSALFVRENTEPKDDTPQPIPLDSFKAGVASDAISTLVPVDDTQAETEKRAAAEKLKREEEALSQKKLTTFPAEVDRQEAGVDTREHHAGVPASHAPASVSAELVEPEDQLLKDLSSVQKLSPPETVAAAAVESLNLIPHSPNSHVVQEPTASDSAAGDKPSHIVSETSAPAAAPSTSAEAVLEPIQTADAAPHATPAPAEPSVDSEEDEVVTSRVDQRRHTRPSAQPDVTTQATEEPTALPDAESARPPSTLNRVAVEEVAFLSDKSKLPVAIVEEHAMVVKYWHKATESGRLPSKGVTLVHLDASGETQPPESFDRPSLKDWDWSVRNDEFIVDSVMRGLITKVVWILPTWAADKIGMSKKQAASPQVMEVGRYRRDQKRTCICTATWDPTSKAPTKWCSVTETEDNSVIEPSECIVKVKCPVVMVRASQVSKLVPAYPHVRDSAAPTATPGGQDGHGDAEDVEQDSPQDKHVILDIDMDFLATHKPGYEMMKVGWKRKDLNSLDLHIASISCPKQEHEVQESLIYQRLIEWVIQSKRRSGVSYRKSLKALADVLLYYASSRSSASADKIDFGVQWLERLSLCSSVTMPMLAQTLIRIVDILQETPIKGLKKLQSFGFCYRPREHVAYTMVRDPQNDFPPPFTSCLGEWLPDLEMLTPEEIGRSTYIPDHEQMTSTIHTFREALKQIGRPSLVTVSRSVRSGLTPPQFSHQLESIILDAVTSHHRDQTSHRVVTEGVSVHYDADLLGGKKGWPPVLADIMPSDFVVHKKPPRRKRRKAKKSKARARRTGQKPRRQQQQQRNQQRREGRDPIQKLMAKSTRRPKSEM